MTRARAPGEHDVCRAAIPTTCSSGSVAGGQENEARVELREKIANFARPEGITDDVLGANRGQRKGSVAVKYRDPKDPANTWTGRGRMPRWLVAVTKGGKAKREDFAI